MEKLTGKKPSLEIRNVQDFRNYKVSFDKAKTSLGFQPLFLFRTWYTTCMATGLNMATITKMSFTTYGHSRRLNGD